MRKKNTLFTIRECTWEHICRLAIRLGCTHSFVDVHRNSFLKIVSWFLIFNYTALYFQNHLLTLYDVSYFLKWENGHKFFLFGFISVLVVCFIFAFCTVILTSCIPNTYMLSFVSETSIFSQLGYLFVWLKFPWSWGLNPPASIVGKFCNCVQDIDKYG